MRLIVILHLMVCAAAAQMNTFISHSKLPQFKDGVSVGNLDNSTNWQEISGLAAPTLPANAAYLWVVSDSPANMLACISSTNASNQGVWTLTSNPGYSDIEDVATARINGQSYIYMADIGDNGNARSTFTIFRIKEPTITGSNGSIAAVDYEVITCDYPAGNPPSAKDAECLLVDPDTGDMYVITKRETIPHVYKLAHASSYTGTNHLTYMGAMFDIPDITTAPLGAQACNVTSGCISQNGKEILVKNYDAVYYFPRSDKSVSIYTALTQTPVQVNYVGGGSVSPKKSHPSQEPQGEAIIFDVNGQNLFSCSEYIATEGSSATSYPLFRYDRISSAPTTATFQDGVSPTAGYAGTLDTYIWDTNPATNNGTATSIVVDTAIGVESDQRKGLLKFDISTIPTTAKVVSAELDLFINTEGQGYKFHKMLVTWTESSTYSSLTTGVDNDGVEAAVASDCNNGINLDTITGTVRNNMALATVQDWVANPSNNFGWLLEQIDASTGDGVQFDSREGATASRRPKLIIKYN